MTSLIETLAEKYSNENASLIDQHLFRFLEEQGIVNIGTVEEIKANLKANNIELITQIDRTPTQEVYTFKLCKVYQSTQLIIPNPTLK